MRYESQVGKIERYVGGATVVFAGVTCIIRRSGIHRSSGDAPGDGVSAYEGGAERKLGGNFNARAQAAEKYPYRHTYSPISPN
jgi:hypothetical protein